MRDVSPDFLTVIEGPHRIAINVDLVDRGDIVIGNVAVLSGNVRLNRRANVYGTCTLNIFDSRVLAIADMLIDSGYEFSVARGVQYTAAVAAQTRTELVSIIHDGSEVTHYGSYVGAESEIRYPGLVATEELVALGVFAPTSVTVDAQTLVVSVNASDRSLFVSQAKLADDYEIDIATNIDEHIVYLVQSALGWAAPVNLAPIGPAVEATVVATGDDPMAACQKLVESVGGWLRFDGVGTLELVTEPDPSTVDASWAAVLTATAVSWDRQVVANEVTVIGTNPKTPTIPRATVRDDDPSSSSYWQGRFGRKPVTVHSPYVSTDEQAHEVALAKLRSKVGTVKSLDMTTLPNPALEPGDVISVTVDSLGLAGELHMLDEVTIGLEAAADGGAIWSDPDLEPDPVVTPAPPGSGPKPDRPSGPRRLAVSAKSRVQQIVLGEG